jgi:NAD-dependent dihydropyrimidine dehydrogenase PreA subunit
MKIEVSKSKCNGCGACVETCMTECLLMGEDNRAYCIDTEYCLLCGSCQAVCPGQAITIML